MHISQKVRNVFRAALQSYGTDLVKRRLWNNEFAEGRWNALEVTAGDFVYQYLEKYVRCGRILDLGCGSGNTGNELNPASYKQYMGVDVSDVALDMSRRRSHINGRTATNTYVLGDIFSYEPDRSYDVILFRDSLYYVRPSSHVVRVLNRYSTYLSTSGVFIVRLYDASGKYQRIVETIEKAFDVLEMATSSSNAVVMVFRPKGTSRASVNNVAP